MLSGVREQIELPGGQAYRVLRWQENLHEVESVLSSTLEPWSKRSS